MSNKIKINKKRWLSNKPSNYAIEQLRYMGIDASVNRVNEKLRNIRGMSEFSYTSIDSKIREANDLLETLCYYIDGTLEDINDKIDEPFFKRFDNKTGILEKFERINLDDYKTKNILGIQEHGTTQVYDYPSGTYKTQSYSYTKENIGLKDLLSNLEVKGFQGMPSFTEMMQKEYTKEVENPEMDLTYEEYVEAILHRSDIQHTVDRGWLNFASDVLDLVGVVSVVALFTGYDFITGEILTDAEKSSAVFNTVINVGLLAITLATAGAGSVAATGMKLGLKGTNKVLLQTLAVDMISGVSGMGAVNLLDAAGSPEYLSAIVGLGVSFFGGYKGGKAVQAIGSRVNSEDIFTLTGLTASQVDDVLKYTGKNLDVFLSIVKNGELNLLLGIPDMNLNYLVKQTGKSTDEITDWLKKNNVNLNDINAGNVDDIIKGASGVNLDDFLSGMSPEDAIRYLEWNDLVMKGFTAEERYNLSKFGSIKTQLDYTTSSGLKLHGVQGQTTTIIGSYNTDMQYVVSELGNIKTLDFKARNGGFNVLNVPDELYNPETFWELYNKPWLEKANNRGDSIVVATKPNISNMYIPGTNKLTGFGNEIKFLEDHDYWFDENIMKMIRK